MPGTIPGTGDATVDKTTSLTSWNLESSGEDNSKQSEICIVSEGDVFYIDQ